MDIPLKPRKLKREEREEKEEDVSFVVLQCPACDRDVKIASDSAGRRMGCPYCHQPLEIVEAPAEVVEETAADEAGSGEKPAKLTVRQPLVFRLLRDEDVSTDHDLEFADEYERRRMPYEAPAWDDERLKNRRVDGLVEVDDGDGEAVGKKLLTRKEQVFRSITRLILGASAVVVVVILYSAIVKTVGVVGAYQKTKDGIAGETSRAREQQEAAVKPISAFMTSGEEESALAVVNGFLNAGSIEERLEFVRDPERVRPLMEAWYAREGAEENLGDGKVALRDKHIDQGRYFIRLAIEFVGVGHRMFAVEQIRTDPTDEGSDVFKLDWETATGYQPMLLGEFKAKRPTTPVEFRVKLKASDYYNYEFRDPGEIRGGRSQLSGAGRLQTSRLHRSAASEWSAEIGEGSSRRERHRA